MSGLAGMEVAEQVRDLVWRAHGDFFAGPHLASADEHGDIGTVALHRG